LPEPMFNWLGEMPYPAMQALFDPFLPKGLQWYWRGGMVKELTDAAIDAHLAQARESPSPLSLMHLYPIDGAVRRVGSSDMAWNTRDATWCMVIAGIDADPRKAGELTRWTRAYSEAVQPHSTDGGYVNFMMEEGDARIKAVYGDNYDRLAALKGKYDPQNVFSVNQNVKPGSRRQDGQ
jgi:berberine-like enzyme